MIPYYGAAFSDEGPRSNPIKGGEKRFIDSGVVLTLGDSPPLLFTISGKEFDDAACLDKLDPAHPDYLLFSLLIKWARDSYDPFITSIEATGSEVTIRFHRATVDAMQGLMLLLFAEVYYMKKALKSPPDST